MHIFKSNVCLKFVFFFGNTVIFLEVTGELYSFLRKDLSNTQVRITIVYDVWEKKKLALPPKTFDLCPQVLEDNMQDLGMSCLYEYLCLSLGLKTYQIIRVWFRSEALGSQTMWNGGRRRVETKYISLTFRGLEIEFFHVNIQPSLCDQVPIKMDAKARVSFPG